MNKHYRYILVACMIVLFAGCATMKSQLREAESLNTIAAYEKFLRKNPPKDLAIKAITELDKLYFENAKATNAPEIYLKFVDSYSETNHLYLNQLIKDWPDNQQVRSYLGYKRVPNGTWIKKWKVVDFRLNERLGRFGERLWLITPITGYNLIVYIDGDINFKELVLNNNGQIIRPIGEGSETVYIDKSAIQISFVEFSLSTMDIDYYFDNGLRIRYRNCGNWVHFYKRKEQLRVEEVDE